MCSEQGKPEGQGAARGDKGRASGMQEDVAGKSDSAMNGGVGRYRMGLAHPWWNHVGDTGH